ncbi:ABC transporter substrate-binding protein [Arthrobacter sp. Leaf141]|uniref:peptide ABC transporter substrate-binding protein n=1 Tax=unclassified Arthrobacter TaxID=235627 RepID=UPI0006F52D28|nr:ABC transporter substrate-binding protein [Arthrobacter sp. Leaf141]KQR03211.1 ABC transporter substrate-binding protein [Arthrobacter sp. Leaf141]
MRFTRTSKALGMAAIAALALTGCGAGGGSNDGASGGDTNRVIIVDGSEPQRPLMPADTNEVGGGKIIDMVFAGLVSYDPSGKPVNEMAESIEAPDGQNYTIKIKSGEKFTNGEAITAKTFVDAWNFGAAAKNAQLSSSFFESIKGYDEVNAEGSTADTMSGLKVVDDTTFTVELGQPESDWPLRLGYSAFAPVPAGALADPKGFGETPVGNGPYKLADGGWQHNVQIQLVPNPDYDGPRKPKNGGVTFKIFQNDDTAYQDLLSNSLDVLQTIPTSALANFESDLGDRTINKPYAGNQTIAIPEYLPEWSGEAGKLRRQAISMAINRDEITKVIFNGARQPAKDFTAPVLDGYSDSIPGHENLEFNETKAKDLWKQADAIQKWDANSTFSIAYNADKGGHQAWVEAVVNQIKNTLGIKAEGKPYPTFKEARNDATAGTLTGSIRAGWQADYPSLYNFLGPIYKTGAGSNDARYANPAFDEAISKGLGASSVSEGNQAMNKAQETLLTDLPAIPLWYQVSQGGWSDNVTNVDYGWNGVPLYYQITGK